MLNFLCKFFIVIFMVIGSLQVSAQYVEEFEYSDVQKQNNESSETSSKWVFGGNFLVGFSNPSLLLFNPRVGYRFTERLIAGSSFTYLSMRESFRLGQGQYQMLNTEAYGPGLHAMHFLSLPLLSDWGFTSYIGIEYDYLVVNTTIDFINDNRNAQQLLFGFGLMNSINNRVGTFVGLYYDLFFLEDNSVFASPWNYRIGILF